MEWFISSLNSFDQAAVDKQRGSTPLSAVCLERTQMLLEPYIEIECKELSKSESMTVRVALQMFEIDLRSKGLGNDEHGIEMTKLYLDNIKSIKEKMGL